MINQLHPNTSSSNPTNPTSIIATTTSSSSSTSSSSTTTTTTSTSTSTTATSSPSSSPSSTNPIHHHQQQQQQQQQLHHPSKLFHHGHSNTITNISSSSSAASTATPPSASAALATTLPQSNPSIPIHADHIPNHQPNHLNLNQLDRRNQRLSYIIPLSTYQAYHHHPPHSGLGNHHRPKISRLRVPTISESIQRQSNPSPLILTIDELPGNHRTNSPYHSSSSSPSSSPTPSSSSHRFKLPLSPAWLEGPDRPSSLETSDQHQQQQQQQHHHHHRDHPRHCLGINALAIDLTTLIKHKNQPNGILYTAGKDGLIAAWELNLPTKLRSQVDYHHHHRHPDSSSSVQPNHTFTSPAPSRSSPTLVNHPAHSIPPKRRSLHYDLPFNQRYHIDQLHLDRINPTTFRQCVQSHTDWCNDILLCNYNQTLISASSDRTVKAWFPHSPQNSLCPTTIGTHNDYVKCLAHSPYSNWVASAGLDRKILLWDVHETRANPLIRFPDESINASIYSLATTPTGQILATGSPAQAIGLYDPRLCSQVAKLVGHTDNVRSILLSDDGSRLLSASSDATVKMWDVRMQRCLHTFSHHSTSVWALHSQHPQLQVFHSGDRSGWLCKVDVEGSDDFGEGECVVLCQAGRQDDQSTYSVNPINESIVKIVGLDDTFVWTATGSSTVQRWRDIPTRHQRRQAANSKSNNSFSSDSINPSLTLNTTDPPHSIPGPSSAPPSTDHMPPPSLSLRSPQSVSFNLVPTPSPRSIHRALSLPVSVSGESRKPSQSIIQPTTHPSSNAHQSIPVSLPDEIDGIPLESLVPLFSHFDSLLLHHERQDPESFTIHPTYSSGDPNTCPGPQEPHLDWPLMIRPSSCHGLEPIKILSPLLSLALESKSECLHTPTILNPLPRPSITGTTAWKLYTTRDSAAEAIPLRDSADDLIPGCSGLIKCELLNDRRHAITLDTVGRLALWDIICCTCKGIFDTQHLELDVDQASSKGSVRSLSSLTSNELLKLVKERIEGQATIATWCTVETRTGLLTVHLDENRCFEAEVYADEAGLREELANQMKEDHRIFLGKWIVRNLFDGFIQHHIRLRQSSTKSSDYPGTSPNAFIGSAGTIQAKTDTSLDDQKSSMTSEGNPVSTTYHNGSSGKCFVPHTPGMTIALATPALTPAILPDHNHATGSNGYTKGGQGSDSGFCSSDYFSLPRLVETDEEKLIPEAVTSGALDSNTDAGSSYGSSLNPPPSPKPTSHTPPSLDGHGGITREEKLQMNESSGTAVGWASATGNTVNLSQQLNSANIFTRFRSFGRGARRRSSHDPAVPPVISNPMPCLTYDTRAESDSHLQILSEKIKVQQQIVQAILSRPLEPCGELDAPKLFLPPDTTILISEEQAESGTWEVSYRGLVATTGLDYDMLMKALPVWLLEFLLCNRTSARENGGSVKITFVLKPEGGKELAGLPDLPNGNARLTASRVLRMKKVAAYVVQKLELNSNSIVQPSSSKSTDTNHQRNSRTNSKSTTSTVSTGSATNTMSATKASHKESSSSATSSSSSPSPTSTFNRQHHRLISHHRHPSAKSDESKLISPASPKLHPPPPPSRSQLLTDRSIQLSCNGKILHHTLTLGVVKQWIWSRTGDVIIHYKLKPS